MLVASGLEAGGHRPAFLAQPQAPSLLSSFALIPQIRDAVSIPLIAAGGIADRRGLLAATALGADAVQVGTAFLACDESGASQLHKSALRAGHEVETALTRVYTGRLARYIKNRLIEAASEWPDMALPYPFQAALTRPLAGHSGFGGDGYRPGNGINPAHQSRGTDSIAARQAIKSERNHNFINPVREPLCISSTICPAPVRAVFTHC
jgi:NAD(P)H-dependent flavin oxidoreductase YrpB (nitropropane dioxygenase family)